MIPPVGANFQAVGPEWSMPSLEPQPGPTQDSGAFGSAMGSLMQTQSDAASASAALASGQATDPTSVVMAVERAQLTMQLASQLRNKSVEAIQDIFHTQV